MYSSIVVVLHASLLSLDKQKKEVHSYGQEREMLCRPVICVLLFLISVSESQ